MKFCAKFRRGNIYISYPRESNRKHATFTNLKRKEDENKFFQILMEVFFLSQLDDSPVPDELTAGLSALIHENKFKLSIIYATQILLDINKALQHDVGRGLSDLQASGIHVASVLKKYNSTLPCPCQQLPVFDEINTFIDHWILEDVLGQFKSKFNKLSPSIVLEPFLLFKRHPLICGLFQFQLHAYLQYHSINLANTAGTSFVRGLSL